MITVSRPSPPCDHIFFYHIMGLLGLQFPRQAMMSCHLGKKRGPGLWPEPRPVVCTINHIKARCATSSLWPDSRPVRQSCKQPAVVHIHCRIFCGFLLIKANTNTWCVVHICVPIPDFRAAREYSLFLLSKTGEFLDTKVMAVQVQMHLRAHSNR